VGLRALHCQTLVTRQEILMSEIIVYWTIVGGTLVLACCLLLVLIGLLYAPKMPDDKWWDGGEGN
jgi:hypothetical protein